MSDGEIWISVATICAVFLGPIFAVIATRIIDQHREVRFRKMEIFRTLMRTRKMPVHYEHVAALNLVEIEFAEDSLVIESWKTYLRSLGEPIPAPHDEAGHRALQTRRDSSLTRLIHEIAKVMKFKVEQLDIMEGNYLPQGWNDDDWSQRQVRQGLLDLLHGRRPLFVQPFAPSTYNPYPPPPSAEEQDTKD